jgi:hypothetical protein
MLEKSSRAPHLFSVGLSDLWTYSNRLFFWFFNTFILWNNEAVVHYTWPLTCGIPRPTRTQASRCGTPSLLATVLTLKSDPERPLFKGAAQSVSTDLGYCNLFNPFYNFNCSAWERAPWRRVTEKSHFFHTKRRSDRDRESNPGHLWGRQRH